MRKLLLLFVMMMTVCACNRMRVRNDHSKQMPSVRVPVDTAQKDYVDEVKDESWKDEDLIVVPEQPERPVSSSDSREARDEIESFMRGEEAKEE